MEGLVKSIATLVLPKKPKAEKSIITRMTLNQRWKNFKASWVSNKQIYTFYAFMVIMNIVLALKQLIYFRFTWGQMFTKM